MHQTKLDGNSGLRNETVKEQNNEIDYFQG